MTNRVQYLLRFDDICPTMNWAIWSDLESFMLESGIKPLVAVVPDNRDQTLMVQSARADFWDRVRKWQASGWAIGLHGYQHLYENDNRGLLKVGAKSEFAGIDRRAQQTKLENALAIFSAHGVKPDVWVAPSHSFDRNTVSLLAALGVPVISDGLWRWPHTDSHGIVWVPQQLWNGFAATGPGVWTICYHHNSWTSADIVKFKDRVLAHAGEIVSLQTVVTQYSVRPLRVTDRAHALWRFVRYHQLRAAKKRLVWVWCNCRRTTP
jgi:predicted deacetylase